MINRSNEKKPDPIVLEEDFNLAFKLVFFDENDREVEPAQYIFELGSSSKDIRESVEVWLG